jgi:hypothetical protein
VGARRLTMCFFDNARFSLVEISNVLLCEETASSLEVDDIIRTTVHYTLDEHVLWESPLAIIHQNIILVHFNWVYHIEIRFIHSEYKK